MFRKRLITIAMIAVMMTSMLACGTNVNESSTSEATLAMAKEASSAASKDSEKAQQQIESEKASADEAAKKASEAMSSMAAAVEKAAQEEVSKEAAAKAEAESIAAVKQKEAEEQAATVQQALEQAVQSSGADVEVVTVVDTYGAESARQQYAANAAVYAELIRLTNELRASLGVAPLVMEENMCVASCKKAIDYYLADYYDGENHSMIDGSKWTGIFDEFGIVGTSKAENLAKGPSFKTAQQMFEGWKNSSIHYNNMVSPKYTRVGVGSCGYVWFMDFCN